LGPGKEEPQKKKERGKPFQKMIKTTDIETVTEQEFNRKRVRSRLVRKKKGEKTT